MLTRSRSMFILGALLLVGCDDDDGPFGPIDRERPENLDARYEWVLDAWNRDTGRPVGHPAVTVTWELPVAWRGDPFRVYARRAGEGFRLIATTTSCEDGVCRYVDTNVVGGTGYEYFVSTVDERDGFEAPSDYRIAVDVPAFTPPPAPRADTAFGLDDAIFVRWRDGGSGDDFWKYQVWLVSVDGEPVQIYQAGETDGTGFLDLRASNGHTYGYRVAALDVDGHVSDLSPVISGVPRPDFGGELIYAYGDSTQASGFRFAGSDDVQAVVSGDAASAQWRLEVVNGTWQIRPLGETEVLDAGLTTALTCAPTPDPGCRAIFQAPTTGNYTRNPVAVNPEFSYVFRVRGDDGRIHYGVIRAEILGSSGGNRLMIFDWAYQLRPEDTRLLVKPG